MRALPGSIANVSPLPREHWATLTAPTVLVSDFPSEATFAAVGGRRFRAVQGKRVGMKTVFHVRAELSGAQVLDGELVPERHPDARDFVPHPWVMDDLSRLFVEFGAKRDNTAVWAGPGDQGPPKLLEWSPCHRRWRRIGRIPALGVVFTVWADVFHDDPVVDVWAKFVWSDRTDPAHNTQFDAIAVRSGEFLAFDFDTRHGMLAPTRDAQGRHVRMLSGSPIALQDGAGLPMSGAMLCFQDPAPDSPAPDPEDVGDWQVRAIRDLQAAAHGPILAATLDWEGYWLANKNTPRFEGEPPSTEDDWRRFEHVLETPATWFANRKYSVGKHPGATGDKEEFGATKGTHVVTSCDPRMIYAYRYDVQAELFRGVQHYEDNGEPLDLSNHPDWVTWSMGTHWHTGVSRDRLGKATGWEPSPPNGWNGYDDQHRSQNYVAAYLALSDDPVLDDHVRHQNTVDLAAYRIRFPNRGAGAARAQGRTNGTLMQLAVVTEADTSRGLFECIARRMQPIRANPLLQVSGPMKVLSFGGPDQRKPIFDEQGNLAPWASMWEHGLALVGLYSLAKNSNTAGAYAVVHTVARTIAEFGCFKQDGQWFTVSDIWYRDGAPPPGGLHKDSRHLTYTWGIGGIGSWVFPGCLVALDVLDPSDPLAAKLREYTLAITGGEEARERRRAEWWAVVPSIQFPAP